MRSLPGSPHGDQALGTKVTGHFECSSYPSVRTAATNVAIGGEMELQ
jgi:hypothetical protein